MTWKQILIPRNYIAEMNIYTFNVKIPRDHRTFTALKGQCLLGTDILKVSYMDGFDFELSDGGKITGDNLAKIFELSKNTIFTEKHREEQLDKLNIPRLTNLKTRHKANRLSFDDIEETVDESLID